MGGKCAMRDKNKIPISWIVGTGVSAVIFASIMGLGFDVGSVAIGMAGFSGMVISAIGCIGSAVMCYKIWEKI